MYAVCVQDLLWRSLLVYRGRINMDHCVVHQVPDGRGTTGPQVHVTLADAMGADSAVWADRLSKSRLIASVNCRLRLLSSFV